MAIPDGYEAQIRPRSGLALNCGITMLNSPGTIDSDYRGEVKVLAINHGQKTFVINRGERIAQMVIAPVQKVSIAEATELPETGRGEGGFGSTGDRKSTRLNSSHVAISYAAFCLKTQKLYLRLL